MEKDYLLAKWLSGEITPDELRELETLEDLTAYKKITEKATLLKTPVFDKEAAFESLKTKVKPKGKTIALNPWKRIAAVAASVAVLFLAYSLYQNRSMVVSAEFAHTETFTLPDGSEVVLNSGSTVRYKPAKWNNNRNLKLDGEAYFKVAKGQKFSVETNAGTITVLGTQFNVKNREQYFEVSCFEGKVQVSHLNSSEILTPGKTLRSINGNVTLINGETAQKPAWVEGQSVFDAIPFEMVLREVERVFNLEITPVNIDTNYHFTGSFEHTNSEIALKAITQPLNLTYKINKNEVTITAQNAQ